MSSSGESRAKSRGKRNSTNLEECPNYPIEYERLELHRKCPRFVKRNFSFPPINNVLTIFALSDTIH